MSSIVVKHGEKHKKEVNKIIRRRMLYAAGLGLIPIPIIDAAGILSIQVLMVKDIATEYRIPFMPHIAKTLIGSLVGGLGALGAVKLIPGLGSVLGGVTVSVSAAATTYAIGKVFATHFDQGGTLLDFDPVSTRKYFEELFQEGQLKTEEIQKNRKNKVERVVDFVSPSKINKARKDNVGEKSDLVSNANLERREQVLEKRRKMIRKNKRKVFLKKWAGYLLLIPIIFFAIYFIFIINRNEYKDPNRELDLYMEEAMARKIKLEPTEELDSTINSTITEFAPNSTENVIAKYIENPESTYPKRYALSAVRFVNNSVSLDSGGKEQLINIASLMKKYPDMVVNLYGHSSSVGPKFSRQKIGRKRARLLKSIFMDEGIPGFRLTGNYIEKANAVHDEYWGAEIVVDISTKENAVVVGAPEFVKPISKVQDALGWLKTKILPEPKAEKTTTPPKENYTTPALDKPIAVAPDRIKTSNILVTGIDTGAMLETLNPNNKEDSIEQIIPEPDSSANEIDNDPEIDSLETTQEETKEKTEEAEEEEPAEKEMFSKGSTEAVILDYIKLPNASFPKAFALNNIRFKGMTKDLNAAGKEQIKNLAALMDLHPEIKINIYALIPGLSSTEMTEDEIYDFQSEWKSIGKKRAQNVKDGLKKMGISNRRIKVRTRRINAAPEDSASWGMEIEVANK